ncbi:DUF4129 domain-containing protein [Nocardia abscessus]|uniref:DUF4129 domain-containing protein n=1 Tax=Nocardia abscessus TaxID=120957 RepID=UPI0024565A38|nr:DUF4129 domain-containing protein [Nocardia abscessus]
MLAGIAAVGLLTVAMSGLVVVAVSSRRKPVPAPAPAAAAAPTVADSLARAAEMGLAAMNAPGQDPRTAIIACYVAMEHGLASDRSAAPLISDTPMEVLARAFERGALHDASARELVALFEEARFSPHAMLEWQRMRAEQLLRIVLADLQGEVPA